MTTDADGRAVAPEIRPVGKGALKIEIRASYQGQTVTRSITQTNFATVAQAQKAGKVPGSSTHDNLSNESNQEANASQSGASSSSASSSAASGAASAGAAAGGHTALVAGLAVAGAGAAAGGAYYAVKNANSTPDCTAQANAFVTAAQNTATCTASQTNLNACFSSVQQFLNDFGALCSCLGGPAVLNQYASYEQLAQQVASEYASLGLSFPSSCQ